MVRAVVFTVTKRSIASPAWTAAGTVTWMTDLLTLMRVEPTCVMTAEVTCAATVTVRTTVSVSPPSSVTTSTTEYVPAAPKEWLGTSSVEVAPSPKSQAQLATEVSPGLDPEPSKVTSSSEATHEKDALGPTGPEGALRRASGMPSGGSERSSHTGLEPATTCP